MAFSSTGDGSAERHEGDRVHSVLEENEAAEMASNVADDGRAHADHGDGDHEARVAVHQT